MYRIIDKEGDQETILEADTVKGIIELLAAFKEENIKENSKDMSEISKKMKEEFHYNLGKSLNQGFPVSSGTAYIPFKINTCSANNLTFKEKVFAEKTIRS